MAFGAGLGQYVQQADAVLSQANPVSTTLYTVLDTTPNVRLQSVLINITWAVTQPSPLEVVITIDGRTEAASFVNPVSETNYLLQFFGTTSVLFALSSTDFEKYRAFLIEARSVKIQARVTWAVTQPTPLVCRVKYAKRS